MAIRDQQTLWVGSLNQAIRGESKTVFSVFVRGLSHDCVNMTGF